TANFNTAFTVGTLSLNSSTATFSADLTNATTALSLNSSTVNGPGTITNATGHTLNLSGSTLNTPLINNGTLIATGNSALSGTLTTSASSTLRVLGDSSFGPATLTIANG